MNEKRETAVKFRVGVFVLVALVTFLGAVYALGARAKLFEARYTIHADFTEVGGLVEGATVYYGFHTALFASTARCFPLSSGRQP